MAVTKIWPVYSNLTATIKYINNFDKTAEQTLVTYQYCKAEEVVENFNQVINDPRATNSHLPYGKKVLARHLIQSFKPHEIDPFTAHQIGMDLIEKHLEGKYQYVIATHVDKEHIHNHIVFNNVSFIDFHCYNSNKKSYQKIREISDDLCKEYGLDIIMKFDKEKLEEYPYATESKHKNTYRDILRNDIDQAVKQAIDFEDYLQVMREKMYEIKQGKYISYRHKTNGQKRFIRDRSLGKDYLKEALIERIDREFLDLDSPASQEPISVRRLELIIDLNSDPKFATETGLRRWAIKQNNNRFMETMNQMIRLGIGSQEQLIRYIDQLEIKNDSLTESINKEKKDLKSMQETTKNLESILNLFKGKSKTESFIKLTPKLLEIFEKNDINFEVENLNSVNITPKLLNQIENALEENKKAENVVKTTISSLLKQKKMINEFEQDSRDILRNYTLFIRKSDNKRSYMQR